MIASIRFFSTAVLAASFSAAFAADMELSSAPDTLVLRDGAVVQGLIVRNVQGEVTIQTQHGEETYDSKEIVRIQDVPGDSTYLLDVERHGDLPPWRTLVNDLRHNDGVRSLEQIPATVIDKGVFKDVPYLSFRINGTIEMNIYGDPNDPAGVELGIYGVQQGNKRLRRICREFLVSYLNTRDEIAALYALTDKDPVRNVGQMTIEFTPASAEDADGAWWLSIYNRDTIAKARLSAAEYARLTRPVDSVIDERGQVRATAWTDADTGNSLRLSRGDGTERLFVRGFYRDKEGNFRLITAE